MAITAVPGASGAADLVLKVTPPRVPRDLVTRPRLRSDDGSLYAQSLRLATQSFSEWFHANQRREALRWAWLDFFRHHDLLIAPITVSPAFPHDHSEPAIARTMPVNGKPVPYFDQLFWAGLATCAWLPATAAPTGLSPTGLPVGLQIIGPEMADRSTIWLAGQLEKLIGGFVPPPDYR